MAQPRQLKSWELKKVHMRAIKEGLDDVDGDNEQDLLNQIRDLTVELDIVEGKLKKERNISKRLRREIRDIRSA